MGIAPQNHPHSMSTHDAAPDLLGLCSMRIVSVHRALLAGAYHTEYIPTLSQHLIAIESANNALESKHGS